MNATRTARIVTRQRGSWRWQDAYSVAWYNPHNTRDGRWIWRSIGHSGKLSMPQIRRSVYRHLGVGSLHNRPISEIDLRMLALA